MEYFFGTLVLLIILGAFIFLAIDVKLKKDVK